MIWDEWGRITRVLESVRLALARERVLMQSLMLKDPAQAKLRIASGPTAYEAELAQHLEAVEDSGLVHSMALVHSYAVAEDAAAGALGIDASNMGGIEVWSQKLLDRAGNDWGVRPVSLRWQSSGMRWRAEGARMTRVT